VNAPDTVFQLLFEYLHANFSMQSTSEFMHTYILFPLWFLIVMSFIVLFPGISYTQGVQPTDSLADHAGMRTL